MKTFFKTLPILGILLVVLILPIYSSHTQTEEPAPTPAPAPAPIPAPTPTPEPEKPENGVMTPGSSLKISINIPTLKLQVFQNGKIYKEYPIAVGQARYQTPTGAYEIGHIEWNPWWLPPDSPWAAGASKTPPGPKNPLGPVKMVMDEALRIHGTNTPSSVGSAASHGCIRMHNEDAKDLAWFIQSTNSQKTDEKLLTQYSKNRGTTYYVNLDTPVPVQFIYEPVVIQDNLLEIFPDVYGKVKVLKDKVVEVLENKGIDTTQLNTEKIAQLKKPSKEKLSLELQELRELQSQTHTNHHTVLSKFEETHSE